MRKIIILIAMVICLPFLTTAQTMNPNVESEFSNIDFGAPKSKTMGLMGAYKIDGEYILLRREHLKGPGKYLYFVERYDEEFNRLKSVNISAMMEQKNRTIEAVRKIKDQLLIVTSDINKSTKTIKTYGQLISFPSLKKGKQVLMYSGTYKKKNQIGLFIKQSQDENNIMVVLYPPYEKKEKEKVQYNVYTSDLELIFERDEVELDENDRRFSVDETIVTNAGEVLIMGTVLATKKDEGESFYKIYRITKDNEEAYSFDEDFEGISIMAPTMFQMKNGNLVGGGYYTGESNLNKGAFLFRFNVEDMEVSEFMHNEFTAEFLKQGYSQRAQKKMDKKEAKGKELGISNLILKDIIPTSDGGFFMVGAVQYIYTTSYTDANGNTHTVTHYVHNDIVVSKVSDNQEFLWTKKITKRSEVSGSEYGFHYEYVQKGDELTMFLRDSKANFNDQDPEFKAESLAKTRKEAVFGAVTITEDGEIDRKAAIDYSDEKHENYYHYNMYSDVYPVDDHNEIIALTYLGKKKKSYAIAKFIVTE